MNHLISLLNLHQPTEETVAWAMQRLITSGFQVERTFDLHAARMSQVNCPCPYHGTSDCTCQMIVLLVHDQKTQPVTIVVHGHDGQTCLSMVDIENSAMDGDVIRALIPVMENSEI